MLIDRVVASSFLESSTYQRIWSQIGVQYAFTVFPHPVQNTMSFVTFIFQLRNIRLSVHRIGRTGRSGKRGVATTFFNRKTDLSVLQDLKQLLLEAGQELPAFLRDLGGEEGDQDVGDGGEKGCAYCSGLGHRITT